MNMQQMLMQAQKMQRELKKAKDELTKKEFSIAKSGMVEVKMLGSKSITSIRIEDEAFEKENKELIEETISLCVNELIKKIEGEEDAINERIAGSKSGSGLF
ncbi:MAG: YbaB/EbfC family nucleoid-associated protein [Erysipelotrichaceae bacterium]|nr:YbaB/EbfC family nucleoid-associated protein [Erysipelotrichaceae bacterium]